MTSLAEALSGRARKTGLGGDFLDENGDEPAARRGRGGAGRSPLVVRVGLGLAIGVGVAHFGVVLSRALVSVLGVAGSTLYPAYCGFEALRRGDTRGMQRWLTYFLLFGGVRLGEALLGMLPVSAPASLFSACSYGVLAWASWPAFDGAMWLYDRFLGPLVLRHEAKLDAALRSGGAVLSRGIVAHVDRVLVSLDRRDGEDGGEQSSGELEAALRTLRSYLAPHARNSHVVEVEELDDEDERQGGAAAESVQRPASAAS